MSDSEDNNEDICMVDIEEDNVEDFYTEDNQIYCICKCEDCKYSKEYYCCVNCKNHCFCDEYIQCEDCIYEIKNFILLNKNESKEIFEKIPKYIETKKNIGK